METWFLREWQRNSPWQILLRPLSWLFALLSSIRRGMYRAGLLKTRRLGVPVIVVGNITVGGTGKTPLVLAVVAQLARAGYRCGIVTRGYVGHRKDREEFGLIIHVVPPTGSDTIVSDEAALLAARSGVPVYAGANRVEAARTLLNAHSDVNVVISDDGLQHYALHRDLEICVFDGVRGMGNGALLPAGPLREPVSRIERVDAVVVNRTIGHVGGSQFDTAILSAPSFSMVLGNESLSRVDKRESLTIEQAIVQFAGKRILVAAGIGHPKRFFSHLARLGLHATETRPFPDHHPFSPADFADTDVELILMTEKDAVKCRRFADERMWFMQVDAVLPEAFGEFLLKRMSKRAN